MRTVPFGHRNVIGQFGRTAVASTLTRSLAACRFVARRRNWRVVPMSAVTRASAARLRTARDGSWSKTQPFARAEESSNARVPPAPGTARWRLRFCVWGLLHPTMSNSAPDAS